jgi:transcriptional regulator with XRE-family HTH domain
MNNLQTTRKAKGLTQDHVCRMTGINQGYFSELERGVNKPNQETRERIESVLGKIDWIETESIVLRDSDYYMAERLLKKLVELTLTLEKGQRSELIKLVHKYF